MTVAPATKGRLATGPSGTPTRAQRARPEGEIVDHDRRPTTEYGATEHRILRHQPLSQSDLARAFLCHHLEDPVFRVPAHHATDRGRGGIQDQVQYPIEQSGFVGRLQQLDQQTHQGLRHLDRGPWIGVEGQRRRQVEHADATAHRGATRIRLVIDLDRPGPTALEPPDRGEPKGKSTPRAQPTPSQPQQHAPLERIEQAEPGPQLVYCSAEFGDRKGGVDPTTLEVEAPGMDRIRRRPMRGAIGSGRPRWIAPTTARIDGGSLCLHPPTLRSRPGRARMASAPYSPRKRSAKARRARSSPCTRITGGRGWKCAYQSSKPR